MAGIWVKLRTALEADDTTIAHCTAKKLRNTLGVEIDNSSLQSKYTVAMSELQQVLP